MPKPSLSVRFWGVRGSIPTPGAQTSRYGGNSPCVEVRCGENILIFDAGSGIRQLGQMLMREDAAKRLDVIFSHCHLDHVIGLPYFAPLHKEDMEIRFWAGTLQPTSSLQEVLRRLIGFPFFPIELDKFEAQMSFRDFQPGEILKPAAGISLQTALLRHPGGSVGFRLEYGGRSFVYVTDNECGDAEAEARIIALGKNADLMICDATFTDKELPARRGWGHSSWQQSIGLATAAGAKRICLFHHDPDHDDAFLDRIAAEAAAAHQGAFVARDGLVLEL